MVQDPKRGNDVRDCLAATVVTSSSNKAGGNWPSTEPQVCTESKRAGGRIADEEKKAGEKARI